jgi:tetratricopeptide (TPR) repeat protein
MFFRPRAAIGSARPYPALASIVAFALLYLCGSLDATLLTPAFSQHGVAAQTAAPDDRRPSGPDAALERSIKSLAAAAKAAFRDRMEPPIQNLNLANLAAIDRDFFSGLRSYVRANFDAAIDALAAEATDLRRALAVEHALRIFVEAGQASGADALFAEMVQTATTGAPAAAALRHSVALVELPVALARLIKPPAEPMPLPGHGEKALPAYRRAAALDAGDAWTWIVLALLENDGAQSETAILNAQRAAAAADDWRAAAFSKQLYGLGVLEPRGRAVEADRAYSEAVTLARLKTAASPSDAAARRELARSLVWLGAAQAKRGRAVDARAAYEEALSIRKTLAASDPDRTQGQVDLIASYSHLWPLLSDMGLKDDARKYLGEASRLYDGAAGRSRFAPTLNALNSGTVAIVLGLAGGLTLVLGLAILALYRRRMTRLMRATAAHSPVRPSEPIAPPIAPGRAPGELPLRSLDAADQSRRRAYQSAPISDAAAALRRASFVYAIAGGAFAALGAVLWFRLSDLEFGLNRAAIIYLVLAWPVVLTLNLLWGQNRRRLLGLLLLYFGALLFLCVRVAFSGTTPLKLYGVTVAPFLQPLLFWGLEVVPTLFLLLFLNRSLRAIGAVLFAFMFCVFIGAIGGLVALSMHGVMKMFISVTSSATASIWLAPLAGMILFAPLGWLIVSVMRRRYEARRLSDQTLVFDSIWLFQTLLLCNALFHDAGSVGWVGLGAFGLYRLIVWIGLRPLGASARRRPPARLLLLRVFGFRRRTERYFDLLGAPWRYAGPIQLIAAPDIANRSIDPAKFLDFLSGGLRRRFIVEPSDLDRRLAQFDDGPDPDGRFRVNELFCGADAWEAAVRRLIPTSDLVVMDLRGFSPNNQGCIAELQFLIDLAAVERTVLLVDQTTDVAFLRETLNACWGATADASPNRKATGALTMLHTERGDARAVDALLAIADDALAKAGPA